MSSIEIVCTKCDQQFNNNCTDRSYILRTQKIISQTMIQQPFRLSNILPFFSLFRDKNLNYLVIIKYFQTLINHEPSFLRPINDNDLDLIELKTIYTNYFEKLSFDDSERISLIYLMPYLINSSSYNNYDNTSDLIDKIILNSLISITNKAQKDVYEQEIGRMVSICGQIARRTCNEEIFSYCLFVLINSQSTTFDSLAQSQLIHIAKDEYYTQRQKKQLHSYLDENRQFMNEKIDLTSIIHNHSESIFCLITKTLLINSQQSSELCLKHLRLLSILIQDTNTSSQNNTNNFLLFLQRFLPKLLPWIIEDRSKNASKVLGYLKAELNERKRSLVLDYFPHIYVHLWRHVQLDNNKLTTKTTMYNIERVYEVMDFIESETAYDRGTIFRYNGQPLFNKLVQYISEETEQILKGLQMAIGILQDIVIVNNDDYYRLVTIDDVFKFLQTKLLGILCDFETELLSNLTSINVKRRILNSLEEILKHMGM
ncbi:unnamed protein product [Didymodactylos carnosus]|uniref:Uncharacterized protein n=1 Tax=Didymodactylos carnosus TaxID=1234261 RepID=A0A816AD90_9BILA|nr:unnamed protein product [Didymodactylos carnosus]CAF4467557.1 unnamed protein product [Didymodactylos carnosus]